MARPTRTTAGHNPHIGDEVVIPPLKAKGRGRGRGRGRGGKGGTIRVGRGRGRGRGGQTDRGDGNIDERNISWGDIKLVQNLIERCLQHYMSLTEIASAAQAHSAIDPAFTHMVWNKLEEQNPQFFQLYYTSIKLKDQIVAFNYLVGQQIQLMQHQQAANSSNNLRNKDAEVIVEGTFVCDDAASVPNCPSKVLLKASNPHFLNPPNVLPPHHITDEVYVHLLQRNPDGRSHHEAFSDRSCTRLPQSEIDDPSIVRVAAFLSQFSS